MSHPLWGGRFTAPSSEIMKEINASIKFDKALYQEDIACSISHCKMLVKQKIITESDGQLIIYGLNVIKEQISSNNFDFNIDLEDIHMHIEHYLHQIIGEVAGKLHTARSRNDQIATDLKLWTKKYILIFDSKLHMLQSSLISIAEKHYNTIMPGFTHLQIAQPVTFGHHMMAYFEMFKRDRIRLKNLYQTINECPLGSAALAGTSFNIDRHFVAKELGFECPTENSIDSVSDRDYIIEFLSNTSICIMHLSRIAEELILWSSYGFKFIQLSDDMTTGSSIMPQKRNPDAAELIRGKAAQIFSSLNQLLVIMKGLPLSYSKDMQEDKESTFVAANNLLLCIEAMNSMLNSMTINTEIMTKVALCDFSIATDIADWLVKNLNISFRKSHEITGKIVKLAETQKCNISNLTIQQLQSIHSNITEDIFLILSVQESVKSKTSYGGTAPVNVINAIQKGKLYLSQASLS
ncbi:argininosuccinate lyase [Neoehrlichia mikurensis]|uniref:Argininosuccinate lyase n=1 Tax=Neoehrlichia mikurensis TaxID=89586 RepID=A0A9Q9BYX1_9RICK|nr:argininosuccinate lyase [Neoehrlichia mikurensis]QXK92155.1 argininosuccinate lyase [Neoehrlichia mikurensis]QXK92611.1 argininosuccinate lyase [Neoehrlichia mikurensis]QXK93849.1 argininosuccinate lyase [Neoehrlichia mikurensis]UTO55155.1 argininosuccinate lyase [Neoehrlichia mikurensis]UTO56075.1 argininosuccinate lyase [Neoehrlichia mikurensis]